VIAASWSSLGAELLPFVLLICFWIFLMWRVHGKGPTPMQEMRDQLAEIQDELRRLRQSVDALEERRR
jgi:preprotein translocase subunit YajC